MTKEIKILLAVGMEASTPKHYRIFNKWQQLNGMKGIYCECVYAYSRYFLQAFHLFDILVFYRTELTPAILESLKIAKLLNKVIIFDIDDLIFDPSFLDDIPFFKYIDKGHQFLYKFHAIKLNFLFQASNYFFGATPLLVREARKLGKTSYHIKNCLSDFQIMQAEWIQKHCRFSEDRKKIFRIGYFSGSNTHDGDFKLIEESLIKILQEFDHVRLVICGDLVLSPSFSQFQERVERIPFIDHTILPFLMSFIDLNLAPIEYPTNKFLNSKSEVKITEFGVLGIPTLCSGIMAYKNFLQKKFSTLIVMRPNDWYKKIKSLVIDKNNCKKIGRDLKHQVLEEYHPEANRDHLAKIFRNIYKKEQKKFEDYIPHLGSLQDLQETFKNTIFIERTYDFSPSTTHENFLNLLNEYKNQKFIKKNFDLVYKK